MIQAITTFIRRFRARPVQFTFEIAPVGMCNAEQAAGLHTIHCILDSWEENLIDADDAKAMLRSQINALEGDRPPGDVETVHRLQNLIMGVHCLYVITVGRERGEYSADEALSMISAEIKMLGVLA